MKRLYRVEEGKMVCGVCGGLSEYLNVDVTIIRLLTLAAILCSGIGLVLYIGAAICMPSKSDVIY
ncbi:MAG: PspC domain-containing protein [Eubacteriales bacterium]|nr:PspC domain-containing protein [Eubacteriales bacterium]